jgi:hypothetical protein
MVSRLLRQLGVRHIEVALEKQATPFQEVLQLMQEREEREKLLVAQQPKNPVAPMEAPPAQITEENAPKLLQSPK